MDKITINEVTPENIEIEEVTPEPIEVKEVYVRELKTVTIEKTIKEKGLKGEDGVDGTNGTNGINGKDGKCPTKKELKAFIKEMFPEDKLLEKLIKKMPKEELYSIEIGEDQNGQWISKNGKKMYIKKEYNIGAGMSTGVYDFIALRDTPTSYVGQAGKFAKVKSDETGLEFAAGDGTGTVTQVDTDATLTGGPITTTGTLGLNLSNANTWVGSQKFTQIESLVGIFLDSFGNSQATSYYSNSTLQAVGKITGYKTTNWLGGGGNDMWLAAAGSAGANGALGFLWNSGSLQVELIDEDGTEYGFRASAISASAYTGTWTGDPIGIAYGGMNNTSYGANRIPYMSSGNTAFTSISTLVFDGTNMGIGLATPTSKLHISAPVSTANYLHVTNGTTGNTSSDGFLIGITSTGIAEIKQQEATSLRLFTNNTQRLDILTNGQMSFINAFAGGLGSIQLNGTGTSVTDGQSPTFLIKHTTDDSNSKSAGIITETRMTSNYLRTWQNIGNKDNSFGNPGVIQWTAWEYTNSAFTTFANPNTEFTGWSYQYLKDAATYINLLRIHTSGVFVGAPLASSIPATVFHANNRTVAAGTPGTLATVTIGRAISSGVSYPQVASFNIGTYSTNNAGNGYGPDTRLDLALKSTSSDTYTTNVNVMTWLDTGFIGINNTAPGVYLHIIGTTTQFRSGYDAATNYWDATTSSAGVTTFNAAGASASFVFSDAVTINGSLTLSAQNIITDTTTGMKIGTATTQKIGFFNATPVVQGASIADATGGVVIDAEARTAINALISRIEATGLIATI